MLELPQCALWGLVLPLLVAGCGRVGVELSPADGVDLPTPSGDALEGPALERQVDNDASSSFAMVQEDGSTPRLDASAPPAADGTSMPDASAAMDASSAEDAAIDSGGPSDGIQRCRLDPNCETGGVGALCTDDGDCDMGTCCTDAKNCGSGMCTLGCAADGDCPSDMACAHSVCFFRCAQNSECAAGMSCEHMGTICEWP